MIAGVENGPPGIGERGEISPCWAALGAPMRFIQVRFPFRPSKGPKAYLILKKSSQVSGGYTHIQRVLSGLQVRMSLISYLQRDAHTQMSSSIGGGFSNERTRIANGPPPEAFRGGGPLATL